MSNLTLNATESHKESVRRLFEEAINERKLELVSELMSPAFVNLSSGAIGVEGYLAGVRVLLSGFPDVQFRVEELFGEDDKVALRWSWEGTHQGLFAGFEPTGKVVHHTGNQIFLFDQEDKIVGLWVEFDSDRVRKQLERAA